MKHPCGLLATALIVFGICTVALADDSYMVALKHSKQDVMDMSSSSLNTG